MTAYSITPEGATEAATEIAKAFFGPLCPDADCKSCKVRIEVVKKMILRHAEQSQSRMQLAQKIVGRVLGELYRLGQGSHVVDVTARNILDAAVEAELTSSEGEMREALRALLDAANDDVGILPSPAYIEACARAEVLLGPAGREENRDAK